MIKESEFCSKVSETEFNKSFVVTEKDHEGFKSFAKCCICKKHKKGEEKVKDHDHITGKYWGPGYQECNQYLSLSKKF